jgi:PAS domain S-box-containing protein
MQNTPKLNQTDNGLPALLFMMHSNPLPAFVFDREKNNQIIEANQRAVLFYGYSKTEFAQKRLQEICLKNKIISAINDYYQHNQTIEPIQTQHIMKDDSIREVEVLVSFVNNFVLLQVRPLEKKTDSQDSQQNSEQRYTALFNALISGFALHEIIQDETGKPIDYRFLEVNPAFEKMTGKRANEIIGKTVLQIWPLTEPYWIEQYGEVALSGKEFQFENFSQSLDKYFQGYAYSPAQGQFASLFFDITETKKQRHLLEEQQELIKELADHITEIFWMRDKDTKKFTYITPSYEKIYREPIETVYQDHLSFLKKVHPDDLPFAKQQFDHLMDNNKPYDYEYRILHADKSIRWVRTRGFPIYAANFEVKRFAGVVEDITDQKLIQQQLREHAFEREQDLSILYQVSNLANQQTGIFEEMQKLLSTICQATSSFAGIFIRNEQGKFIEQPSVTHPPKMQEVLEVYFDPEKLTQMLTQYDHQKIITGKQLPQIPFLPDDQIVITPLILSGKIYGHLLFIFHPEKDITAGHTTLLLAVADQLSMVFENLNLRQFIKISAISEERQRISRELHDSVTQSLYSLNLISQAGLDRLKEQAITDAEECLVEIQKNAIQSLKEMRLLLYELNPPILEEAGLVKAVQNRLNSVERKTNTKISFETAVTETLSNSVQAELYRIIIEALNNSLKHAKAGHIDVNILINSDAFDIKIKDDGIGFVIDSDLSQAYGLKTMRERAKKIKAELSILTKPQQGTTIRIYRPRKKDTT